MICSVCLTKPRADTLSELCRPCMLSHDVWVFELAPGKLVTSVTWAARRATMFERKRALAKGVNG